ncbi:NEW3 domain-containing protein [Chloroflexota bacterium]
MSKIRAVRYLLSIVLLFTMLGGLIGVPVLAAQENDSGALQLPPNQEGPPGFRDEIGFRCDYPVLVVESGEEIDFEVELLWYGSERRRFDLETMAPPGWKADVYTLYGGYPEKPLAALEIEPLIMYGNSVKIVASPAPGNLPEPGDYIMTLKVSSEDILGSYDVIVRVIPSYEFGMVPQTLRYDFEAQAGEGKNLAMGLINAGSASIEDIVFTATTPEGWIVAFNPERIDAMAAQNTQELNVVITPPEKASAGDWPITLHAESKQMAVEVDLRVNVSVPGIWGWVVILVVVVVVAGAGVLFWRLGRR